VTFQVKTLILYGRRPGQVRTLDIRPGELNIITGDSRTGKTSIWTIVDYCLGSSDYPVRAGKVREHVSIFALQLVRGDQQVFIARPAPEHGTGPAPRLCVQFQTTGAEPLAAGDIKFSFPLDAARNLLTEFCGIDRSVRIPAARGTTMAPSIRHSLFFCLQAQNEVANPDHLFHSQGDEWRPQAIRDTLPYFLGVVDSEQAQQRARLKQLRADLRSVERQLARANAGAPAPGQALALVTEAIDASLLAPEPVEGLPVEAAMRLLASALTNWPAGPEALPGSDDPVLLLDQERERLRARHRNLRARITDLKQSLVESSEYLTQAIDQRERLASLNLLRPSGDHSGAQCPVCQNPVTTADQTVAAIREDLARLDADVVFVNDDAPHIQAMIAAEEERLLEVRSELSRNREQREELEAGLREVGRFRNEALRAAAVRGRISMFLENATRSELAVPVIDTREDIQSQIDELEDALGDDTLADRLASNLSLINQTIWDKARKLELEHSEHPIRLDLRRLSIVADSPHGPVPLNEMGSGENWLGYHIATLLSLHEWFSDHGRPLPRMLILDQPSQVYFPSDYDGSSLEPVGEDRVSLRRAYQAIADTVQHLAGDFQVIIMEHADLDDELFRSAVVERWRGGHGALIPREWIEGSAEF
jgi:hypothetical protein